jgi:hypothetical protein
VFEAKISLPFTLLEKIFWETRSAADTWDRCRKLYPEWSTWCCSAVRIYIESLWRAWLWSWLCFFLWVSEKTGPDDLKYVFESTFSFMSIRLQGSQHLDQVLPFLAWFSSWTQFTWGWEWRWTWWWRLLCEYMKYLKESSPSEKNSIYSSLFSLSFEYSSLFSFCLRKLLT